MPQLQPLGARENLEMVKMAFSSVPSICYVVAKEKDGEKKLLETVMAMSFNFCNLQAFIRRKNWTMDAPSLASSTASCIAQLSCGLCYIYTIALNKPMVDQITPWTAYSHTN